MELNPTGAGSGGPRWSPRTFLNLGLVMGLVAGLVEAGSRLWLQASGAASFEMRLTALSFRIVWVAPLVYALTFGLIALGFGALQVAVRQAVARRMALVACSMLVFVSPLASSGRIGQIPVLLLSLGLALTVKRMLPKEPDAQAQFFRRVLPWLAVSVVVLFAACETGERWAEARRLARLPAADPHAPNILVIVLDTLRADHVSSYGYHRETTPVLTQIAREGVQFNRAIAPSSWTLPTHVSLLTGHYASRHGATMDRFDNRVPTIGAALAERGYRTGAISANTVVFSRAQGFGEGFIHFDDSFYSVRDALFRTYYFLEIHKRILMPYFGSRETARRSADNVTSSAVDWIDADTSRPFFLVLNYFDMHDPYVPPQPWRRKFSQQAEPGGLLVATGEPESRFTAEEIRDEIDAYDGAIAYADHAIGQLLARLDSLGLRERTAVVVTSDHGESLGQHGLMWHGTSLYIEQVWVPLVIRFPIRIPAGVRIDTPVSHTSLPATLLELAGGGGAIRFPQRSLSGLWSPDSTATDWPAAVSELSWIPLDASSSRACGAARSVVTARYHLIEHATCTQELYDLNRDAGETENLAALSEYRQIVEELQVELNRTLGSAR